MAAHRSMDQLQRLVDIVAALRAPDGGCPWDRKQTHLSLRRYLVEESAEFLDAVEDNDHDGMREELGDLLLQVVLHAQIASENGHFNLQDVAQSEAEKMLRRHPHVFHTVTRNEAGEELRAWDDIKRAEKGQRDSQRGSLGRIPRSLPALARAQKALDKAEKLGFVWPDISDAINKIEEELGELREAAQNGSPAELAEELGDLLFTMVNLCRWQNLQAEEIMQQAVAKFVRRFHAMEEHIAAQGRCCDDCAPEELIEAWKAAKIAEGAEKA
jgi:tetrapyrrole methylase family protein/MazG family protein